MMTRVPLFARCFALLVALLLVTCGREAPPRAAVQPTTLLPSVTPRAASTARPTRVPATPRPTTAPGQPTVSAVAADPRALGDPNAPITIVEYSDFQ